MQKLGEKPQLCFTAPPPMQYKYNLVANLYRAMERPRTVRGLARFKGLTFRDVELPCTFCGRLLTYTEKKLYDKHLFRVRWIGYRAFGCCQQCLRISGRLEFKFFFEKNVLPHEVGPLVEQQIRCKNCLRPLTFREKRRLQYSREFFYIVRGHYRSYCTLCRLSVE